MSDIEGPDESKGRDYDEAVRASEEGEEQASPDSAASTPRRSSDTSLPPGSDARVPPVEPPD
jgi:hypothetical protein